MAMADDFLRRVLCEEEAKTPSVTSRFHLSRDGKGHTVEFQSPRGLKMALYLPTGFHVKPESRKVFYEQLRLVRETFMKFEELPGLSGLAPQSTALQAQISALEARIAALEHTPRYPGVRHDAAEAGVQFNT